MICKFKLTSVNAKEEQWATAEPNIQRTSVKGTKQKKRFVKNDKASCPHKVAYGNKRVRLQKISIPLLPPELPPADLH